MLTVGFTSVTVGFSQRSCTAKRTLALFKVCNGVRLTRWLQLGLDFDATAIRPRYDHSTTYVTIVGLPECGLLH